MKRLTRSLDTGGCPHIIPLKNEQNVLGEQYD